MILDAASASPLLGGWGGLEGTNVCGRSKANFPKSVVEYRRELIPLHRGHFVCDNEHTVICTIGEHSEKVLREIGILNT